MHLKCSGTSGHTYSDFALPGLLSADSRAYGSLWRAQARALKGEPRAPKYAANCAPGDGHRHPFCRDRSAPPTTPAAWRSIRHQLRPPSPEKPPVATCSVLRPLAKDRPQKLHYPGPDALKVPPRQHRAGRDQRGRQRPRNLGGNGRSDAGVRSPSPRSAQTAGTGPFPLPARASPATGRSACRPCSCR